MSTTNTCAQPFRSSFVRLAITLLFALYFCQAPAAFAQSSDEAWYRQMVRGLGKTLYFFAWPTDDYDHMEFGHIERKPGGADVYVVLYGNSWLEGNLWTEVVTEVRNGDITGMHFGRYSSKALIAPGSTVKAWGDALSQLNDELNRERQTTATPRLSSPAPQPTNVSVVCISNPTPNPITYSVPSEQVWSKTLAAGDTWMYWHTGPGLFSVSLNGSTNGNLPRTIHLKGALRSTHPDSCDTQMVYDFVVDSTYLGLSPRTWIPGSEAPFIPNVYRGEAEGKWNCAAGYKWASTDEKDLTCLSADTGLIGLTIGTDAGTSFPVITAVRSDGPAGLAGVPAGAHLIHINGSSVLGMSVDAVVSQIRGPVNTVVRIAVQPPGSDSIQYFNLRRQ